MANTSDPILSTFADFCVQHEEYPLRDLIYMYIREEIISGRLPSHQRLLEEELANCLSVSRTPVREALRKLEVDGLIKYHRRRGMEVRQIDIKDIEEIYDLCAIIEGYAVRVIAEKNSKKDIERLQTLLSKMRQSINDGDEAQRFEFHTQWHEAIYVACKNKRAVSLLKKCNQYISLFHLYSLEEPTRVKHAWQEHEKILRAIEMQDGVLAETTAREHVLRGKEAFLVQWHHQKTQDN